MGVATLATAFVTAANDAQRVGKSLVAVSGSSSAAASEMGYIRATANRMGLNLQDAAQAYIGLSAAAKAARAEVEQAAQSTAALMGNGAVQLYQEHQAAIAKNGEEVGKLTG